MGVYLNPGAESLREARRSKIYVDKSGLIAYLNGVARTKHKYVCVSRPRRFGKSMAADMVCAYYDRTVDREAEFAGLAITRDASHSADGNRFDVVRINMQAFLSATHDVEKLLAKIQSDVAFDLRVTYKDLMFRDLTNLPDSMADAYAQTGTQFVIVIDEWDCVMREMQDSHDQQEAYLDFLRAWLKDQTYVALAYMTGILPIKKYGTHSALNMFDEFSMLGAEELASFVGFTEPEVRELCETWGRSLTECNAWYDGYRVPSTEGGMVEAYSPRSVVRAMETGNFRSFWNETETFDALRRYINLDMDGLHGKVVELIGGGSVEVNTGTYVNDMTTLNSADDVLTLLVHLGYLTYDAQDRKVRVPNREVMGEFANSVSVGGSWGEVARTVRESEALLDALVAGDAEKVAAGVERAHEDAASIIAYNDESSLAATLRLAFFSAIRRWRLVREAPAGEGFADLVLIPLRSAPAGTPGIVIELKYGDSPQTALDQIAEKSYERALEGLAERDVIHCGIAYDPKTKTHGCLIKR